MRRRTPPVVEEKYLDTYVASIKEAFESLLDQTQAIHEVIRLKQSQIINPRQEDDF